MNLYTVPRPKCNKNDGSQSREIKTVSLTNLVMFVVTYVKHKTPRACHECVSITQDRNLVSHHQRNF